MRARQGFGEALLLEAIAAEWARLAGEGTPASMLLIGMQGRQTVAAANQIAGPDRVALLHLDRAAGAVGCSLGNPEAYLGDGSLSDASAGPAGSLDRASYRLIAVNVEAAKSYRVLRAVLNLAAEQVSPDGSVLVVGPKKGGAEVAATRLRDLFEQVELLTYRKGHRVYRGTRPLALPTPPLTGAAMPDAEQPLTVWLRGLELHLIQDDRIFARGQLDPATRMLAEVMEILPGADVLDLGCGGGVLGILAARLQPSSHCTLVDSDPLAVAAARRGAALSGADNASVHLSDVLDDVPGQTFDVVVMNPPFHRGRQHDLALADRFLAAASAALRPGGKLWVVCNRFQPFERTLTALLGPVREMAGDASYKVLVAERSEQ